MVNNLPANVGDLGLIPGLGRFPDGGHGNPLRFVPGESPWTEGPGGLQSRKSQRIGHDWATKHSTANTEKANTISLISYYHIIHSSISGKNIWKNWVTIGTWGPSIGDERKSLRERQGGTWGKGFSFSCVCETPVWTVDLLCKNEIWLMRPERALTLLEQIFLTPTPNQKTGSQKATLCKSPCMSHVAMAVSIVLPPKFLN